MTLAPAAVRGQETYPTWALVAILAGPWTIGSDHPAIGAWYLIVVALTAWLGRR